MNKTGQSMRVESKIKDKLAKLKDKLLTVLGGFYLIMVVITAGQVEADCRLNCKRHIPNLENQAIGYGIVWPLYWYEFYKTGNFWLPETYINPDK